MEVTIGRTVLYRLNEDDAHQVNEKTGNYHSVGQILPLIVAVVWKDEYGTGIPGVNGQVILDGPVNLWVTSRREGTENGTWFWPPRV